MTSVHSNLVQSRQYTLLKTMSQRHCISNVRLDAVTWICQFWRAQALDQIEYSVALNVQREDSRVWFAVKCDDLLASSQAGRGLWTGQVAHGRVSIFNPSVSVEGRFEAEVKGKKQYPGIEACQNVPSMCTIEFSFICTWFHVDQNNIKWDMSKNQVRLSLRLVPAHPLPCTEGVNCTRMFGGLQYGKKWGKN
jgi:hypothetical protein